MIYRQILMIVCLMILMLGCGPNPDATEIARESMDRQAEQNSEMARLNTEMAQNNERLAEARTELNATQQSIIDRDAEGRQELAALQRETESFVVERHQQIALSQNELEAERQVIARQRHRDPIIAAAIQNFGLILACLAPIGLAIYLLYSTNRYEPSEFELAGILLQEIGPGSQSLFGSPCSTEPCLTGGKERLKLSAAKAGEPTRKMNRRRHNA